MRVFSTGQRLCAAIELIDFAFRAFYDFGNQRFQQFGIHSRILELLRIRSIHLFVEIHIALHKRIAARAIIIDQIRVPAIQKICAELLHRSRRGICAFCRLIVPVDAFVVAPRGKAMRQRERRARIVRLIFKYFPRQRFGARVVQTDQFKQTVDLRAHFEVRLIQPLDIFLPIQIKPFPQFRIIAGFAQQLIARPSAQLERFVPVIRIRLFAVANIFGNSKRFAALAKRRMRINLRRQLRFQFLAPERTALRIQAIKFSRSDCVRIVRQRFIFKHAIGARRILAHIRAEYADLRQRIDERLRVARFRRAAVGFKFHSAADQRGVFLQLHRKPLVYCAEHDFAQREKAPFVHQILHTGNASGNGVPSVLACFLASRQMREFVQEYVLQLLARKH